MPRTTHVEVRVELKVSKDYNSELYAYASRIELEPGDNPDVVRLAETSRLREAIRKEFRLLKERKNGENGEAT